MRVNAHIKEQLQKEFNDVFTGIGQFDGILSLQIKANSKPYKVLPPCIANALQNIQRRVSVVTVAGYSHIFRSRGNSRVVQQFCVWTKTKWKG